VKQFFNKKIEKLSSYGKLIVFYWKKRVLHMAGEHFICFAVLSCMFRRLQE